MNLDNSFCPSEQKNPASKESKPTRESQPRRDGDVRLYGSWVGLPAYRKSFFLKKNPDNGRLTYQAPDLQ
jgi:hypothetical protein